MKNEMLKIFNETANAYYLAHTSKSFEALKDYNSDEKNSWADGLNGDEWEDVAECMACAEEKASQAIEQEME